MILTLKGVCINNYMETPQYPNFKDIDTTDVVILGKFTQGFLPFSDFNPLSLICWNSENINGYSFHNGNLIIRLKDYLTEGRIFSVLGNNDIESTVDILLSDHSRLSMVPDFIVSKLDSSKYNINPDRDSFDYIIDLEKFSSLSGGDYKGIRRHIRVFEEAYSNITVRKLKLTENEDSAMLLSLTKDWANQKKFNQEKLQEDIHMIQTFLELSKGFTTNGYGLFKSGRLIAYTLNELIGSNWVMGHFGKSSYEYEYSSLYIEHATALAHFSLGYKFLNHQQDTGLIGLRESKMALHPIKFLEKYTISFKV